MKELAVTFFIALAFTCFVFGLEQQIPPYPQQVGIGDMQESSFGLKRDEGDIPEINYTDGPRANKYMTTIEEKSQERNVDWPLGANN